MKSMNSSKMKGFQMVKKLRLLEDDVQAAKTMRENLMNENDRLQDQIDQVIFEMEELRATSDKQHESPKKLEQDTKEATFFGNLNEMERQETCILGEMDEIKKQLADFTHEYAAQKQRQKNVKNKLEIAKQNYEIQSEITSKSQSDLDVAKEETLKLTNQLNDLYDSFSMLQEAVDKKEEEYKYTDDTINNRLEKEKRALLEEKKQLYDKLDQKESQLKKTQDNHDKNVIHTESETKQRTSVGSWLTERKILLDKIKKKRTLLSNEKNSLQREKNMTNNFNTQFKQLFGESDPDGTGPLAKLVVMQEIDSIECEDPELVERLKMERVYNESLEQQYKLINNTLKELERHKNYTMHELNEEKEECMRKGYLTMLEEELNVLIASLSN